MLNQQHLDMPAKLLMINTDLVAAQKFESQVL